MSEVTYSGEERLSHADFLDFLKRADLRRMYPKRDFEERLGRALARAGVTITARQDGELIGTCMGLTDTAYFFFLTDLSVSRSHAGQGIEEELMRRAVDAAGGAEDITVIAWSAPDTMAFHERLGIIPQEGLIARDAPIDAWFNPAEADG